MIGRVVEIAEDGRHLSVFRGFMKVEAAGEELGRVPLDDISALIVNAHGTTYSNNLLVALSGRGVPLVVCAANHQPQALLWPVDGHHAQSARMQAQAAMGRPLAKRLWRQLVQAKIRNQGSVLACQGHPSEAFESMARRVRSGDPDNLEAQAARRYWPLLFGSRFRRDPDAAGVNACLNYGYAIIRSGVARAVAAAGLHPTLGLFHRGRGNPMCLVDDLMEPFRPIVDLHVRRNADEAKEGLSVEMKRGLAGILQFDMRTEEGVTPLGTCFHRQAQSLAAAMERGKGELALPREPLPLDLAGLSGD